MSRLPLCTFNCIECRELRRKAVRDWFWTFCCFLVQSLRLSQAKSTSRHYATHNVYTKGGLSESYLLLKMTKSKFSNWLYRQAEAESNGLRLRLSKKPCRKFKNKKLHKAKKAPSAHYAKHNVGAGFCEAKDWGRVRDSRILDWICLFASVKLYANRTFSKALFARGLLPPRKLGTFLPEEGFLESHLLLKMTESNFQTDFIDKVTRVSA